MPIEGRPFKAEIPADMPLFMADPTLLGQAVTNLLINAALHTPAGTPIVGRTGAERHGDWVFNSRSPPGRGIKKTLSWAPLGFLGARLGQNGQFSTGKPRHTRGKMGCRREMASMLLFRPRSANTTFAVRPTSPCLHIPSRMNKKLYPICLCA